tara:strand:- start:34 stop:282 length:249 start_codon:yes stop_codon:yes gene_type:complete
MLSVRCRVCGKELIGHATKAKSCGCDNMTTVTGDNVTARDLSQVVMLNSGKVSDKDVLSSQDLAWQEERRKRKVKKLNFEVR